MFISFTVASPRVRFREEQNFRNYSMCTISYFVLKSRSANFTWQPRSKATRKRSILLSEPTSPLSEKPLWNCFFPRWVWHPQICIKIGQGSRGSDSVFSHSAQCTEVANKAKRLNFVIGVPFEIFRNRLSPHYTGPKCVHYANLFAKCLGRYQPFLSKFID